MTTTGGLTLVKAWKVCDGFVRKYTHASTSTGTTMTFSIFLPSQAAAADQRAPVLYWLSGLTCTDDNFIQKAGAFRAAAQHGIAIVCPDTSPRGCDLPGEKESWDFGAGAGFYVNATREPWSRHYRMYDYVTSELPALVEANLPVTKVKSISGHSMGGHGALISFLKNPAAYRSVSAFAPICHPSACPWGVKAFTGYLGDDREAWKQYDATELVLAMVDAPVADAKRVPILIDQGGQDEFLVNQLLPGDLAAAGERAGLQVTQRMQAGYDHSYFFIQTFIEEHIAFHAKALRA